MGADYKPTGNRILARIEPPAEKTEGGIHLPEPKKTQLRRAEVLEVGPGEVSHKTGRRLPIDVSPGDRIVFLKRAAVRVDQRDTNLVVVGAGDVLARLDGGGDAL